MLVYIYYNTAIVSRQIKKERLMINMIRIPCPRCGKFSYTEIIESSITCGECGTDYSSFPGRVCRKEPRKPANIPFRMQSNGQDLRGKILNLSTTGVGVKIFKRCSTKEEDCELITKDGIIFAKNVWCRQYPDFSLMGLKKIDKDIGLKGSRSLN